MDYQNLFGFPALHVNTIYRYDDIVSEWKMRNGITGETRDNMIPPNTGWLGLPIVIRVPVPYYDFFNYQEFGIIDEGNHPASGELKLRMFTIPLVVFENEANKRQYLVLGSSSKPLTEAAPLKKGESPACNVLYKEENLGLCLSRASFKSEEYLSFLTEQDRVIQKPAVVISEEYKILSMYGTDDVEKFLSCVYTLMEMQSIQIYGITPASQHTLEKM